MANWKSKQFASFLYLPIDSKQKGTAHQNKTRFRFERCKVGLFSKEKDGGRKHYLLMIFFSLKLILECLLVSRHCTGVGDGTSKH